METDIKIQLIIKMQHIKRNRMTIRSKMETDNTMTTLLQLVKHTKVTQHDNLKQPCTTFNCCMTKLAAMRLTTLLAL